jgi:riboflavin synthase
MFTGIIEEIGVMVCVRQGPASSVLQIGAEKIFEDLRLGDSVAVNGVCLTASKIQGNSFFADVMSETLNRSALGMLKAGDPVNLERAMAANGRFGGHIVSGHIDGTGKILQVRREDNAVWYRVGAPSGIMKYIVEKGSIAIDGISLTVARTGQGDFSVSVIPHTAGHTILSRKGPQDTVNLENDIIGKYVEKLTGAGREEKAVSGVTRELLRKAGYSCLV